MSFTIDVNADAPSTTFSSLLATVRANCPLTKVDGAATKGLCDISLANRFSKPCIRFGYAVSGSATDYIFVYWNTIVIGRLDFPAVCAREYLPWTDFTSSQAQYAAYNRQWVDVVLPVISYPTSSYYASVLGWSSSSWYALFKIVAAAPYDTNPGIKPYDAVWCRKYTDKDANVQEGSTSTLNSTNIVPTYNVQQPGSEGTFQSDFVNWMQTIANTIAEKLTPSEAVNGESNLAFQVKRCADRLATITAELDQDQGGGANPSSLLAQLAGLKSSLDAFNEALTGAVGDSSAADNIDALADDLVTLKDELKAQGEALAGKLETVGTNLVDEMTGENVAEVLAGQTSGVDLSTVETNLQNIAGTLTSARTGANIADVIDTKTLPPAQVDELATAIADAATAVNTQLDAIKSALPDAAKTYLNKIDTDLMALVVADGGTATAAGAMATELAAIAGLQASNIPAIIAALGGLASIASILASLSTLLGDKTIEFGTTTAAMFDNIESILQRAFVTGEGSYVKDIRDGIGYKAPPDENTYDESVRGQLEDLADGLYITAEDGETRISFAELFGDTNLQFRWGDVMFQWP